MSMLQVSAIGRLTADVELKNGNSKNFVGFNLAVNTGYGDNATTEFLQCILFDTAAERFVKAGVKKGSLIWLNGKLQLRTFTRKDKTEDKCMNVQVADWGYIPTGGNKEKSELPAGSNTKAADKAEKNFTHFDETAIDDDEELPF